LKGEKSVIEGRKIRDGEGVHYEGAPGRGQLDETDLFFEVVEGIRFQVHGELFFGFQNFTCIFKRLVRGNLSIVHYFFLDRLRFIP